MSRHGVIRLALSIDVWDGDFERNRVRLSLPETSRT